MAVDIRIPVTTAIEADQLQRFLSEHIDRYRSALDLTANPFDPYSQVDQVEIMSVDVQAASITIEYLVTYSAFHACHDRTYTDTSLRRITASREGRVLTFIPFELPGERSTGDEL